MEKTSKQLLADIAREERYLALLLENRGDEEFVSVFEEAISQRAIADTRSAIRKLREQLKKLQS